MERKNNLTIYILVSIVLASCNVSKLSYNYVNKNRNGQTSKFSFTKDSFEFVDYDGRRIRGIVEQGETKNEYILTENMYINNNPDYLVFAEHDSSLIDSIEFNFDVNGRNNLGLTMLKLFCDNEKDTISKTLTEQMRFPKSVTSITNCYFFIRFSYGYKTLPYQLNTKQFNRFKVIVNMPKNMFIDTKFSNTKIIIKRSHLHFKYKNIMADYYEIKRLKALKYYKKRNK